MQEVQFLKVFTPASPLAKFEARHSSSLGDLTNDLSLQWTSDSSGILRPHHNGHSDPHVENLIHFFPVDFSTRLNQFEDGRNFPGTCIDYGIEV